MLSQVAIKNYRGFQSYKMEGLRRVNLLVGKNNSGKSAILEGIQFLTSGGDQAVLAEVAERRGELILPRADLPHNSSIDISHFFHGHAVSPEAAFSIQGDNGYQPVTVKVHLQKSEEEPARKRQGRSDASGLFLAVHRQGDDQRSYRISQDGGVDLDNPPRSFRRVGLRRASGPHVRFIGPDSLNTIEMAMMWDEVALTGQEVDVAQAMRVLEPNLASVHFLTGMLASGFYPGRGGIIVGFSGQDWRLPIGSMGDGMRRLMALATALAFTKRGCLFADEIDTGLHYSVMADMWKMVITKAMASDTQVFATTHSWDCIEGLSKLCELEGDLMSQIAIHKIDRSIAHSIAFQGDSVIRMAKADIDPR